MKRILFIVLIFAGLALSAQNPLGYNDGNFPLVNYRLKKTENTWLKNKDSIYSAFKINHGYYASGVKWSQSSEGFAMAFKNDNSVPVKNGFDVGEEIYWGVGRMGVIYELLLDTTYTKSFDEYAIFTLTKNVLPVVDNPYYSLDPIWPEITGFKIDAPVTTKALKFYQFIPGFSALTPEWTSGSFTPELLETNAKLTLSKGKNGIIFLNACTVRFSKEDVAKGYFILRIHAVPLKNSSSEKTFEDYKIYW